MKRSKKRAKRRARQEEKKVWVVELRLMGASKHYVNAVRFAGNHAEARYAYKFSLDSMKGTHNGIRSNY